MKKLSVKLNTKYLEGFVTEEDIKSIEPEVLSAVETLNSRSGAGSDFLGWLDLPVDYDKEEFARIKKAAEKIRSDSDVLVVIGIGGSYLGARAAIEFCRSQNHNKFDKPEIYFAGNTLSSAALSPGYPWRTSGPFWQSPRNTRMQAKSAPSTFPPARTI